MFRIYYLKFTEFAMNTLPPARKLINEHYVFSFDKKFFVMTSKLVPGLKSTYIHCPNIEGQLSKSQYVIEHLHIFDPKLHIFEFTAKGSTYLAEHQEKFAAVIESLKSFPVV